MAHGSEKSMYFGCIWDSRWSRSHVEFLRRANTGLNGSTCKPQRWWGVNIRGRHYLETIIRKPWKHWTLLQHSQQTLTGWRKWLCSITHCILKDLYLESDVANNGFRGTGRAATRCILFATTGDVRLLKAQQSTTVEPPGGRSGCSLKKEWSSNPQNVFCLLLLCYMPRFVTRTFLWAHLKAKTSFGSSRGPQFN